MQFELSHSASGFAQYPLPEQKAIAEVLSSLDDEIDLLHRQNKKLEAMAETWFRQWFIEDRDEGWEEGRLGDIVRLKYGKGLSKKQRSKGKYPVVGSSGIIDYHIDFLVKGPGIVFGRNGTIGKVIYISDDFYPIDTTFYIEPRNDNYGLLFIYQLLKSLKLDKLTSDSAVPGLNREIAENVKVIIPDQKIVLKFETICKFIYEKKTSNDKQALTLAKMRDNLLPKLINGTIRIKALRE